MNSHITLQNTIPAKGRLWMYHRPRETTIVRWIPLLAFALGEPWTRNRVVYSSTVGEVCVTEISVEKHLDRKETFLVDSRSATLFDKSIIEEMNLRPCSWLDNLFIVIKPGQALVVGFKSYLDIDITVRAEWSE
jgi:hypothetical protein